MKRFLPAAFLLLALPFLAEARLKKTQSIYEIKVYSFHTATQEEQLDNYFKNALVPALHRLNIKQVGIFKPLANDTAAIKKIYTLIPFQSLNAWSENAANIYADKQYQNDAVLYINAFNKSGAYDRQETILLRAFPGAPYLTVPTLTAAKADRIYELRSYESSTEKQALNKIKMFNDGDEIGIFKNLGFNAVFYGSVIAGSHMPNLMYLTTHANMEARAKNWKNFSADSSWKKLLAVPEYKENVSRIEITFLRAAPYSDY